jgi:cytochrome c oxidase cbb3-type subunit 2
MNSEAISTALGSAGIVLFAGFALVLAPYLQLDGAEPSPGLEPYTALEAEGRDVYVSEGCVYCHSQQPRDPQQAPDGERGWGRPSVPGDYVYDYPHQLGTMRTGPDLFNVGARLASDDWHYLHLYQPRAVSPGSVMPGYPYLFEHKEAAGPDDRVVVVPDDWLRSPGVVVARPEAVALVAYLLDLDHTAPVVAQEEQP